MGAVLDMPSEAAAPGGPPEGAPEGPDSPRQADWFETARRVLPGGAFGSYALPEDAGLVIRRGAGARVQNADGRWYVDYVCGAGALILGHAHPAVVAAARAQVEDGLHFFGSPHEPALRLAETLVETIPCAEKLIFATTGSEATAYALRLARAHTGRDKILKFEGAFHGNHDYSVFSIAPSALSNYPQGRPDSAGVPRPVHDTVLVAPYNDLDAARRIVEEHRADLAAVIVEPVQRIVFPHPEFLPGLRRICDDNDVLLLFDEVVTGFRLGLGGGQAWFDAVPDLASYGKIVGGGGPLSCIAGRADVIDLADPARRGEAGFVYVNGTLHGNPVAAAAGSATLAELARPGVYEGLHAASAQFLGECQKVLDRHRLPAVAAGKASFWQILFLDREPESHADVMRQDAARARDLDMALLRNGVSVLPNVRRFVSLVHDGADYERTLDALDAACRAVA